MEISISKNGSNENNENEDSALAYAWGKYRIYAHTARKRKKKMERLRGLSLALFISGAVLGTVSQDLMYLNSSLLGGVPWLPKFLSALALGLAIFFGRKSLKPEKERQWIRSRSMAEALKRETFLYRVAAPPYHTGNDKGKLLEKETNELLDCVENLQVDEIPDEKKKENLPSNTMSLEEYIEKRLLDQIKNFYRLRESELKVKMEGIQRVGLWLEIACIVLGAATALGLNTVGWIPFVSTIALSIASYAFANRYQYLIISYGATAQKLEQLLKDWEKNKTMDIKRRNKFILECESVISIENQAWMACHVSKKLVNACSPTHLPAMTDRE